MHLENSQSLNKCIDHLGLKLSLLNKNQMGALQECKKVTGIEVKGLLEHSLNDCIQALHEVFLVNIEGLPGADFNDLEDT